MPKLGATYRAVKGWFWPQAQIKSRLVCLDFLRGVAILLVLGHHAQGLCFPTGGISGVIMRGWQRFGWTGVDLFFVLSGFLVGGLLLAEIERKGHADVRRFLIRRGFKIWPAYYVFLLCVPALMVLFHESGSVASAAWSERANFVHLQNYWREPSPPDGRLDFIMPRRHTWSLAVEEHFYLGLALLLGLLTAPRWRRKRAAQAPPLRWLLPLVGVAMVACLLARWQAYATVPGLRDDDLMFPSHLRVDGLFFGVGLAYLYHFHSERFWAGARWWPAALLAGLALISPLAVVFRTPLVCVWGFTTLYLGYGLIMLGMLWGYETSPAFRRVLDARGSRVVAYLGFYSYSVYLWHMDVPHYPLAVATLPSVRAFLGPAAPWVAMVTYLVAALAGGIVLGRAIEIPALAVRDRLFPRRAAALEEPAGGRASTP
jgi:peptidoglycan/LPS O-acetylase OafA/YrhL